MARPAKPMKSTSRDGSGDDVALVFIRLASSEFARQDSPGFNIHEPI